MAKTHIKYFKCLVSDETKYIKVTAHFVFPKEAGVIKIKIDYPLADNIEQVLKSDIEDKKLEYIFLTKPKKEKSKPEDFYMMNPCNDCPYRLDAPLRKWDVDEFKTLVEHERTKMGTVYGCHKDNGHACVGWLINQDNHGLPSITLRMRLMRLNVGRDYLDNIGKGVELFKCVEDMVIANYPEEFEYMEPIVYHK